QPAALRHAQRDHGGEKERDQESLARCARIGVGADHEPLLPGKRKEDADAVRQRRRSGEGAGHAASRGSEGAGMLRIAEQPDGKLNRASLEAVAAAQASASLSAASSDRSIRVAVLGAGVDAVAKEIAAADVAEVITVDAAALKEYTADGWVLAL